MTNTKVANDMQEGSPNIQTCVLGIMQKIGAEWYGSASHELPVEIVRVLANVALTHKKEIGYEQRGR